MSIPNLAQPLFTGDGKTEPVRVNPNFVLMLQQLITFLQSTLSDEGFKLPPLDAATITQLNTQDSKGAIVYNTTTNKGMINENGVFKTIQTS